MSETVPFRVLLFALLAAFVAHRAYYNRKFPPQESETVNQLEEGAASRIAALISIIALISSVIYLAAPGWLSWASLPLPGPVRWAGAGVVLAGFALLEWSHRALAANWSDQPRITQAQQLVQNGPYRRIRHPIYTSFLLILGATLLITANWLVGFSWIVSVGIDAALRIRFEEQALHERFGQEYAAYAAKTGSLLPKL